MKSGLSFVLGVLCATLSYADSLKSQSVLGYEDFASGVATYGSASIKEQQNIGGTLHTQIDLSTGFFNNQELKDTVFQSSITLLVDLSQFPGGSSQSSKHLAVLSDLTNTTGIQFNASSDKFRGYDSSDETMQTKGNLFTDTAFPTTGQLAISMSIGDLTLNADQSYTVTTTLHTWLTDTDTIDTWTYSKTLSSEILPSLNSLLIYQEYTLGIEQLYVHDFALSANQVQSLMYEMTGNVPEPATSSLALFGLAALLFRRQR